MGKEEIISFIADSKLASTIKEKGFAEFVSRCADAKFESFVKLRLSGNNSEEAQKVMDVLTKTVTEQTHIKKDLSTLLNKSNDLEELVKNFKNVGLPLTALNTGLAFANLAVGIGETYVLAEKIDSLRESLSKEISDIKADTAKLYQIEIDKYISEYDSIICNAGSLAESIRDNDQLTKDNYIKVITDMKVFISKSASAALNGTLPFGMAMHMIEELLPVYTEILAKYQLFYKCQKGKCPNVSRFMTAYNDVTNKKLVELYKDFLFLDKDEHLLDIVDYINDYETMAIWEITYLDFNERLLKELSTEQYEQLQLSLDRYVEAMIRGKMPEVEEETGVSEEEAMQMLACGAKVG